MDCRGRAIEREGFAAETAGSRSRKPQANYVSTAPTPFCPPVTAPSPPPPHCVCCSNTTTLCISFANRLWPCNHPVSVAAIKRLSCHCPRPAPRHSSLLESSQPCQVLAPGVILGEIKLSTWLPLLLKSLKHYPLRLAPHGCYQAEYSRHRTTPFNNTICSSALSRLRPDIRSVTYLPLHDPTNIARVLHSYGPYFRPLIRALRAVASVKLV